MSRYYVAFGSNVGDRLAYLRAALRELKESGATVLRASAVYETPPWGKTDQPAFLNAVALVESDLSPTDFLALLQAIEAANERTRDVHLGPRFCAGTAARRGGGIYLSGRNDRAPYRGAARRGGDTRSGDLVMWYNKLNLNTSASRGEALFA